MVDPSQPPRSPVAFSVSAWAVPGLVELDAIPDEKYVRENLPPVLATERRNLRKRVKQREKIQKEFC
jgi:hypothetical protein